MNRTRRRPLAAGAVAVAVLFLSMGGAALAASGSGDSPIFTLNTKDETPVAPGGETPGAHRLGACRPNPFNPSTTIEFTLGESARVDLAVYDLAGRRVRRLVADERLDAGPHHATWDGRDARGQVVSAGVYLYRLRAGGFSDSKRMTLVK